MSASLSSCSTVYVGNLDERVSDRVLYDILIQAGRVLKLHFARDKETDRFKGYAFAEYETHEIADYAVKLFSGLVILYERTLKFSISGQDKLMNGCDGIVSFSPNSAGMPVHSPLLLSGSENSLQSKRSSSSCRGSFYPSSSPSYSAVPIFLNSRDYPNGYGSPFSGMSYDLGQRLSGSPLGTCSQFGSGSHDRSYSVSYPSSYW